MLLVDDPPAPSDTGNQRLLAEAMALPGAVEELLSVPRMRAEHHLAVIERRAGDSSAPTIEDVRAAGDAYEEAATWVLDLGHAEVEAAIDHTDVILDIERLLQLHRRLVWTFRTEVSAFQRKAYLNLTHEPNKAMNLNRYIGLAGGAYCEQVEQAGVRLVPAGTGADRPAVTTTIPVGTYPGWSRTAIYEAGDRTMVNDVGYEARWWNQADEPGGPLDDTGQTAWKVLGN